ncbi:MAB_1171c family putative transporter [Amycolatopsis samaneae]|uniref:MAB_1171c family putative transporter n=1 Tax=Amycolatopsis samaneae TaxID=664691 RepID=A0ABW5GC56_9PSEU
MLVLLANLQSVLIIFAVTGALYYWIRSWRRSRTPALLANVKALAALDVALLLGVDFGAPGWLFGITTLPNYVVHVLGVLAAYWLQAFVLYLAVPVADVPPKLRTRRRILIGSQVTLAVLYVLGPMHGDLLPAITGQAGNHALAVAYLAVFELYLGLAMLDVVLVARHARELPRGYLRTGLRLLRWGGILGLAFAVHKALTSVAVAAGLPWWAQVINGVLPGLLTTAAILLLMAGITVPAVAPRRLMRRHYREMEPLWRDLVTFAPEVRFEQIGRADITDRVRQRMTEINDVLAGALQPWIDPAVHARVLAEAEARPDAGHPPAATAQAATIATALVTAEHGAPVNAERPVSFTPAVTIDYRDEAAWLAAVATAYSTSPVVAQSRQEAQHHADPAH